MDRRTSRNSSIGLARRVARRLVPASVALVLAGLPALADDPPVTAGPAAPAAPAETNAPAKSGLEWFADFDRAVERAKAEGKDLLVDFTGSDWCPPCKRLHEEVLAKEEFGVLALNYVLVSLDFPKYEAALAKVPNPARNEELRLKYQVDGFPSLLLMTADGIVFGRAGYTPIGVAKYVEMLAQLRDTGRAALVSAIALAKEYAEVKPEDRAAAAEKVTARVEGAAPGDAWVEVLVPAARAVMDLDAENAKGLRLRVVRALLTHGAADDAVIAAARKLDPKNELGILEKIIFLQIRAVHDEATVRAAAKAIDELDALGAVKDREIAQAVYANAAFWNLKILEDGDRAKAYAVKLKAVADPKDERLAGLLEAILGSDGAEKPEGGDHEGHDHGGPEKK